MSRSNSDTSEDQVTTPTTPGATLIKNRLPVIRKDGMPESVPQSVPRDWNWSTF
jgi:hypothetical protein